MTKIDLICRLYSWEISAIASALESMNEELDPIADTDLKQFDADNLDIFLDDLDRLKNNIENLFAEAENVRGSLEVLNKYEKVKRNDPNNS